MILFLNFAPLAFGGGMERWINTVAAGLSKKEKVVVIEVDPKISNIYSQLVLKRSFDNRFKPSTNTFSRQNITWQALIPFSSAWQKIRTPLQQARVIYSKLEVNELLLIIYFGGLSAVQKTVIGLHSPFLYNHETLTLLEKLHNIVYSSRIMRSVLAHARKIHALNPEQMKILRDRLYLSNITHIPNFIEKKKPVEKEADQEKLFICFIGELDQRKGADRLLDVIRTSPSFFHFNIIGNGQLQNLFINLNLSNAKYLGYINQHEIDRVLSRSDVLLMPSKAESFSLACLEALAHGLTVVCSPFISASSLQSFLMVNKEGSTKGYVNLLTKIYKQKKQGKLLPRKKKVQADIARLFSQSAIINQLEQRVFSV